MSLANLLTTRVFFRNSSQDGLWLLNFQANMRNFLIVCILAGIALFFPNRLMPYFKPGALFLIIFPLMVYFVSWLYVKLTIKGFQIIERQLPGVCLENEYVTTTLLIHYNSPIPFFNACFQDHFPAVDILSSPEIYLDHASFADTAQTRISYGHRLNRGYGNFSIGPAEIRVQDPFNLFAEKKIFELRSPLKVWLNPPAPDDLDLIKANALTPMGDSRSSMSGYGMDFYGIKEYVQGDDIRAMSWLKTAQTGKPVIKQFERDTRPDVLVAIHTDRRQLRGFGFGNTMKRLLRVAAAILGEACHQGLPASLNLCVDGNAHHLKISSATPIYSFVTEILANLEPAEDGALEQLVNLSLSKAGPGSIILFLSQTMHLNLDTLLSGMISLKARGAKVSLWAIDDTDQVKFSEESDMSINRDEFKKRLEEMGLDFVLLSSRSETTATL